MWLCRLRENFPVVDAAGEIDGAVSPEKFVAPELGGSDAGKRQVGCCAAGHAILAAILNKCTAGRRVHRKG